jgi:hypothetical protein
MTIEQMLTNQNWRNILKIVRSKNSRSLFILKQLDINIRWTSYYWVETSNVLELQGHASTTMIWFIHGKLQTIGFIGPAVALLCLNYAKTPAVAATLLTAALSLSSFSQAGFMLNIQVSSTHGSNTLYLIHFRWD